MNPGGAHLETLMTDARTAREEEMTEVTVGESLQDHQTSTVIFQDKIPGQTDLQLQSTR